MRQSDTTQKATKEATQQEPASQHIATRSRRWLLVAMLALATLAMHAVLTGATPREAGPTPTVEAVDFRLPSAAPQAVDTTAANTATDVHAVDAGPVVAPGVKIPKLRVARAASGPVKVSATLDRQSVLAGSDGRVYAEVVFEAEASEEEIRRPSDLIVVLDHSGSMGGHKLEQAKRATLDLINRLDETDTFALVTFASNTDLTISPGQARPEAKQSWRAQVGRIGTGGGTNMVAGLDTALGLLRRRGQSDRPCRVLLLSDGHPDTTDGLDRQAREASQLGAALSALGIGEDFNEVLMGNLADLGTGNYYFLNPAFAHDEEAIAAVFAGELEAGRGTVARDLRIAFTPQSGTRLVEAAGYPLEHEAGATSLRPGHLFAGQTRRLWLTLEVDAAKPFDGRPLGGLQVSWSSDDERHVHELGTRLKIASVVDEKKFFAGIDSEAWGRAVISEEFGKLQNQVADLVRSGRHEEAKRSVEQYANDQSYQNTYLMNDDVTANLAEIEALNAQIEEAFTGADQARKRKVLSKSQHELSQKLRRIE